MSGSLAALLASKAVAEDGRTASPPDTHLAQAVVALDSASFDAREAAMQTLVKDDGIPIDEIGKHLGRPDLSCEQRQRLGHAYYLRFLQQPRAAIGVVFSRQADLRGIAIFEVEPKFPAVEASLIHQDDVIDSIDGQPLGLGAEARDAAPEMTLVERQDLCKAIINSYRPGDTVKARVLLQAIADLSGSLAGGPCVDSRAFGPAWLGVDAQLPLGKRDSLVDPNSLPRRVKNNPAAPIPQNFQNQLPVEPAVLMQSMSLRLARLGVVVPPATVAALNAPTPPVEGFPPGLIGWDVTRVMGIADSVRNPLPPTGMRMAQVAPGQWRMIGNAARRQVIVNGRVANQAGAAQMVARRLAQHAAAGDAGARPGADAPASEELSTSMISTEMRLKRIAGLREDIRRLQEQTGASGGDPSVNAAAGAHLAQLRTRLDAELAQLGVARPGTKVTSVTEAQD